MGYYFIVNAVWLSKTTVTGVKSKLRDLILSAKIQSRQLILFLFQYYDIRYALSADSAMIDPMHTVVFPQSVNL